MGVTGEVRIDDELRACLQKEIHAALRSHRRRATIVAFSGDMDRLFAAMSIAAGAAASGLETTIFFTFWGLAALRKLPREPRSTSLLNRLLHRMLPSDSSRLPVSSMNFGGAGAAFFRWLMRSRNVASLPEILADARELGVKFVACQMSLDVLGLTRADLIDGVEIGGVSSYLQDASESTVTLFV